MSRESLLVATLVEMADLLVDDYDVIEVLTVLSHRCVEAVDIDAAGIMLAPSVGELQFIASSSDSMKTLERFQIHADEGPCVDCIRNGLVVTKDALSENDDRWPMFAPRAIAFGFHSVHCLPMRLRGRTIGGLNLFRTERGSLSADDVVVARGLADVATIAILQHQSTFDASTSNSQLNNAINSRVIIEQAEGMIRQATSCEKSEAFDRLRAHVRNHNEGLTVIARRITNKSMNPNDLDEWMKPQGCSDVPGTVNHLEQVSVRGNP